ncbi:MAG: anthranilate synthase component I [Rhodocyclales bacterium CG17_big_fil_post_rev_8_21_14_2_50_68_7]|nr:MAG: anthranilate synthase component I [Betaproteobacteria bacterium CG2_30_68_42]PIV72495.1 MAG: anthranilate synthase component I [Rhodocyclales bacterium CG17_big_fil_post_rev_8_21_14_2_50_68_7]PIX76136.1 MAG: anthranilate synthase component I [Rhodocyclales bacterium CG_4_10_14_3_um_filter_68_10]PJA56525.1 MAG: anthranilate synthase component I [Rhodocyclales bacterium CG_4_9_14_3_um_filter_68_10]
MNESEFNRLAGQGYNRIPVVLETFADLDTPLSIYLKLSHEPYTYLLESVQGGERFGRYSFIGLASPTRIAAYGRDVLVLNGNRIAERREDCDPLAFVAEFMGRFRVATREGLPRFCGGLVGYFGYDTVRNIEPRLAGAAKADDLGTPDILLLLSEEIAIVDNLSGKLTLVVYAEPGVPGAWQKARSRLAALVERLRAPVEIPTETPCAGVAAESGFGEEAFKRAVARARQYIVDGDIMQVVLSQRLSKPFRAAPLALYRALRTLNPSPYMFFFDFDDFQVVGASPEILVRLEGEGEGKRVTLRPIAGTRPRGATPEKDEALAAELLADEKERAEHLMLLDLGRNDVGRVAATGTVRVTERFVIERYSHVMHLVSNVEGRLAPGLDALAVLRACFPAGTVSGAPKVRAMEIIDELEPVKRGIYAGAVGYLGFDGDMDLAIAIRTALIKDGVLHVQAGAGIVFDSDPAAEWRETGSKARALLRAAEMAEAGLDTRLE